MKAKEFTIVEKKRKNRKLRWAAYGPGPYGMYGVDTGYSGDGGIGEDQNQIKIYMSHDPDYMGAVMVKDYNGSELATTTIPSTSLDGFEPDSKMKDPRSAANVEKIIKGIKSGDNIPPILVRKLNSGYQVIDGHHRFWAQKKIGIHDISVKIVPSKYIQDVKNKDEIPPEHLKEDQDLTELNVAGKKQATDSEKSGMEEAKYPGNVGIMELIKFFTRYPEYKPTYLDIKRKNGAIAALKYALEKMETELSGEPFVKENFADGRVKGKSRPGRVKKSGASCKGSVTDLRARAKKYGGERGKMYHWCANMKGGKKK